MSIEYTVIIPIYCEAESLIELSDKIFAAFESINKEKGFEIIFVDDGSTDSSREIIKRLCVEKPYVRSIFLRKHNGKAVALMAGFLNIKGNYIVTIDGDLQDNPEDIPRLIEKLDEGYDLVSGWKQKRCDSRIRVWGSWFFNCVVSFFGGIKLHDFNCGFKIYKAEVIKNITVYGQNYRFLPLIVHFRGFRVAECSVSHFKRKYGRSKYPAIRYQGFFDLMSILFTYKYKFSPLYFFGMLGMFLIVPSLLMVFYLAFNHFLYIFGFGYDYILRIRPLLSLSFTLCLLGVNIFLTGFVCDFILHHTGRTRIVDIVESVIEEKIL